MTTKTVVGAIGYGDTVFWSIMYQPLWLIDNDWDHPSAGYPQPSELELAIFFDSVPLLRSLDNFLSINLGNAISFINPTVGVQAMLCNEHPDPAEFSDVEHWSEVSIRFEAHKNAEDWEGTLGGDMGSEPSNRYPELREFKIPPGTWRVRAEATEAPGGTGEFLDMHINHITPGEFADGKGTWDTLPFQLKLWFWPETEVRPAKHSPIEQKLADAYELAERAYIKKWNYERGID